MFAPRCAESLLLLEVPIVGILKRIYKSDSASFTTTHSNDNDS